MLEPKKLLLLQMVTQITEAVANVPVDRLRKKMTNLQNAADSDYAAWERFLMALGWSSWDVNPDLAKQKSKDAKSNAKKDSKKEETNQKRELITVKRR